MSVELFPRLWRGMTRREETMAQSVSLQSSSSAVRLLFGFIAGFVATFDLSPDWIASAAYRRHDTQHAVQHELAAALWRASVHLAFVLGRRMGHHLCPDRAVSRSQPRRLLGGGHPLRRDLSDGSRLVHRAAAERSAGSRCLPGPWHLYRADSKWPVGTRDRAVSELDAGIGRPRSVMLSNYR